MKDPISQLLNTLGDSRTFSQEHSNACVLDRNQGAWSPVGVIIEAINVIVPVAAIESRYAGGLSGYEAVVPNRTFCSDGYLTRVGFTAPPDVGAFISAISASGLRLLDGDEFEEIAVVDQRTGPTRRVGWLQIGQYPDGLTAAWLVGTSASPVAIPVNWTPTDFKFHRNEEMAERFLPLTNEKGNDVLLDFKTGKEIYVVRTTDRPMQ